LLEPSASKATSLRGQLRALATQWALSDELSERLVLVVNALFSNVVAHAQTRCRVLVRHSGEIVRVLVTDSSIAVPAMQESQMAVDRARGLRLVAAFSRRWGWSAHTAGKSGKTVWATLDTSPYEQIEG
jgi:anti-sigma regulatory factor (Ser/Thr protein kinase)